MYQFIIQPNSCLSRETTAFYHTDYHGGDYKKAGTIEQAIVALKNDPSCSEKVLGNAMQSIRDILLEDLPKVIDSAGLSHPTVCAVPRAKAYADPELLWFVTTVSFVAGQLFDRIQDGTNFIKRHKNTKTTHLNKTNRGGDGDMPYPGIMKDTCRISPEVAGKDILLIDDVYTANVNVDEDAIQALFDNGAKSVIFYVIGKTLRRF